MEGCCYYSYHHCDELQLLFMTLAGDPISFCTKDLHSRQQVEQAIKNNGGQVTDTPGPHTVYLVSKPKSASGILAMESAYNTFSADYITDCIGIKQLKSLKDYWIHKVLDFDDERFDPFNVMCGNLRWEDCKMQMTITSASGTTAVDADDELFYNDDCLTQRIHPKTRKSYSHKERIQILEYIKNNNGYNRVNGNALWKEIEEKVVCPRRTWQSMREHFRHYIAHHFNQFPNNLTDGFRHASQRSGLSGSQAPLLPSVRKEQFSTELDDGEENHVQAQERKREGQGVKNSNNKKRLDKPSQAPIDIKERTRDKSEEKRQLCMPCLQTDNIDEKENENNQESPSVIPQLGAHDEGNEKRRDEDEGTSFCQLQKETEEKKENNEANRIPQKPNSLSHSQANEKEEIVNFKRQLIVQKTSGVSVSQDLLVLAADESNTITNKNNIVQQNEDEQQEPDSSIGPLEDSEKNHDGDEDIELQMNTSYLSSSSVSDSFLVSSFQRKQLSGVNEEMDVQCLMKNSDTSPSLEIPLFDRNFRMSHSPCQSVTEEEHSSDKVDASKRKREKIVQEELLGSSKQIERSVIIIPEARMMCDYLSKENSGSIIDATSRRRKMEIQYIEEEDEKEKEEKEGIEMTERRTRSKGIINTSYHPPMDGADCAKPHPRHKTFIKPHQKKQFTKNSRSFSVEEDLAILKYLEDNNEYSRVGGNSLWKEISSHFTTDRTGQSLKERFRKRIVLNLQSYIAHGLSNKSIFKLKESITINTGAGESKKQLHMQKQRQQQGESPSTYKEKKSHSKHLRNNKMESDRKPNGGLEKKIKIKQKSNLKQWSHKNIVCDQVSEVSKTKDELWMERHCSKRNEQEQQDSHSEIDEDSAMRDRNKKKRTISTAKCAKLKKRKIGVSLNKNLPADSSNFKIWKQNVLKNALGSFNVSKGSNVLKESQESPTNSSGASTSTGNSPFIQEDIMLASNTHSSSSSVDLRNTKVHQKGRQMRKPKKQGKQQIMTQRDVLKNSDDSSDSEIEECDESEAVGTRSRTFSHIRNDTGDSDSDSLLDLSDNPSSSLHRRKTLSEKEEESDNEGTSSDSSCCLFDLDSQSEYIYK